MSQTEYKTLIEKMKNRVNNYEVNFLKNLATTAFLDTRDEASDALTAILETLEEKMPEHEYLEFCNSF